MKSTFRTLTLRLLGLLSAVAILQICPLPVKAQQTPYIIGGQSAPPGAYPWMAALFLASEPLATEAHFCGGTLIGPQHILTAAHCITDRWGDPIPPTEIEVLVGQVDLPYGPGKRIKARGLFVHPDYNPVTIANDFGLIKLDEPVAGPYVQVALPGMDILVDETPTLALGWGMTNGIYPILPVTLQSVELPAYTDATAQKELGRWFYPNLMLAAGLVSSDPDGKGAKATCFGDSGGPLLMKDAQSNLRQIGVTSWGFDCTKTLGVLSQVTAGLDFITSFPPAPPHNVKTPEIVGSAKVGSKVTCDTGSWVGDPTIKFELEWLLLNQNGESGNGSSVESVPCPGFDYATCTKISAEQELTLGDELAYRDILCSVKATNDAGSVSAGSLSVYVEVDQTIVPTPTPTPDVIVTPAADLAGPEITLVKRVCRRNRCYTVLRVADPAGVSSVDLYEKRVCGGEAAAEKEICISKGPIIKAAQMLEGSLVAVSYAKSKLIKGILSIKARDSFGNLSVLKLRKSNR